MMCLMPLGMAIQVRVFDIRWVPDPTGTGMRMIFYPRVAPVPESIQVFFSHTGNLMDTPILYYRYNSRL
jgi:hypothetical protein